MYMSYSLLFLALVGLGESFVVPRTRAPRRVVVVVKSESFDSSSSNDMLSDAADPADPTDPTDPWGSLDPTSETAQRLVLDDLQLSTEQYDKLVALSYLVTDWNDKINLVSRKDCTPSTIFGRHILPCIAICAVTDNNPLATDESLKVVDVGTGGGFPGLPLAICYPQHSFVLLDSVGKKLTAVADMAEQLELEDRVTTYHGRAEGLVGRSFDVVTGRAVSDLAQFCAWIQHFLNTKGQPPKGNLLYWTGGELPSTVTDQCTSEWPLHDLVPEYLDMRTHDDPHGKRIVQLPAAAVRALGRASGVNVIRQPAQSVSSKKNINNNQRNRQPPPSRNRKATPRGAWRKRGDDDEDAVPKQRGYEGFQRFSSLDQGNAPAKPE
jgi:16S rRNA (guanine527-N7)-methyltransferase